MESENPFDCGFVVVTYTREPVVDSDLAHDEHSTVDVDLADRLGF